MFFKHEKCATCLVYDYECQLDAAVGSHKRLYPNIPVNMDNLIWGNQLLKECHDLRGGERKRETPQSFEPESTSNKSDEYQVLSVHDLVGASSPPSPVTEIDQSVSQTLEVVEKKNPSKRVTQRVVIPRNKANTFEQLLTKSQHPKRKIETEASTVVFEEPKSEFEFRYPDLYRRLTREEFDQTRFDIPQQEVEDPKELEKQMYGMWFAGAVESEWSIYFLITTDKGKQYLFPVLRFITEKNNIELFLEALKEGERILGIPHSLKLRTDRSIEIVGESAIQFSTLSSRWVLSRQLIFDYFAEYPHWSLPNNYLFRHQIIELYKNHPNVFHLHVGQYYYEQLLENPFFLAGVLDHSAKYTRQERSDLPGKFKTVLRINSSNHILMDALGKKLGVNVSKRSNESRDIRIAGQRAKDLIHQMGPYLKVLSDRPTEI